MIMPPIYFSHGNGFPSLSYTKMLDHLRKNHSIHMMPKIGHHAAYPITDNWSCLVDELIADIEKKVDVPVISVGHSLGGVLSYMASVRRPDLFCGQIALDSFFPTKIKLHMLYWAKRLGWIEKLTPAGKTKYRRTHWQDKATLEQYLASRAFFKDFDPDCLQDYIHYGFDQTPEKSYTLAFNREREYQIYCAIPDRLSLFQRQATIHIPSILIYGTHSHLLKSSDMPAIQKYYHLHCISTPGSHMFPLEHPITCAEKIQQIISTIILC